MPGGRRPTGPDNLHRVLWMGMNVGEDKRGIGSTTDGRGRREDHGKLVMAKNKHTCQRKTCYIFRVGKPAKHYL